MAADFTGDGRVDVITGDITSNNQKTVLYVAPHWKPVVLAMGMRTIYGLAMDVVAVRYHPRLVYWLHAPKDPMHDKWDYHLIDDAAPGRVDGVHGLYVGDVDRDGKLDIVCSSGNRWARFPIRSHGFASRAILARPHDGIASFWQTATQPD